MGSRGPMIKPTVCVPTAVAGVKLSASSRQGSSSMTKRDDRKHTVLAQRDGAPSICKRVR